MVYFWIETLVYFSIEINKLPITVTYMWSGGISMRNPVRSAGNWASGLTCQTANGQGYVQKGIAGYFPVHRHEILCGVECLNYHQNLFHIAFDSVSLFIFLIIFFLFLLHCLSVRALAKQALLQFLVCALACANCKCACF